MHLNASCRSLPAKTYILVVMKLKSNQIKLVTFLTGMRNSHPQECGWYDPYILYLTTYRDYQIPPIFCNLFAIIPGCSKLHSVTWIACHTNSLPCPSHEKRSNISGSLLGTRFHSRANVAWSCYDGHTGTVRTSESLFLQSTGQHITA